MSRLGASFERSTVYQVREQARLDLATGRRKSGASLGRERVPLHAHGARDARDARDVRDANCANNGGESGDWDRQFEAFRARGGHAAGRNGSSLHGAVAGIDYTSRPVTPAHSDRREQDLWHRPELVDDDHERGSASGSGYGERPSTAAAFGNADDGGESMSFDPNNQRRGNGKNRRKSGMERDGQSAHQRQRRRNERRREKRRLAEAKAASGGQAPHEIRRHTESASSWSWAQDGSREADAQANLSSSVDAGRKNGEPDDSFSRTQDGSLGAKLGDEIVADFQDHDEEAHRELAASAARWKPIVTALSGLVPKLEMAAAMAGRQTQNHGKADPLLPVAEEIERRVAAAGVVAVELLDLHKEEVKQQQRNGPTELDENCRAMLYAFSAVRKRILKAYHSFVSKLGKGERVRLQIVLCRVMFRMVAVATALDVCYPGASSLSSSSSSSSSSSTLGNKKAFDKARARRLKQLHAVARSLFNLSKNKSNDAVFREEGILHSLLELLSGEESAPTTTSTASIASSSTRKNRVSFPMSILVYTTGTLRNICVNDDKNQKVLAQQGAITTLTDMLNATAQAVGRSRVAHEGKRSTSSSSSSPDTADLDLYKQRKNMCQLLVFITGCIRCLFKPHNKKHFKQFWGAGTVEAVCRLVREFEPSERQSELTMNCVRLLSNFSLQSRGRDLIVGRDRHSSSTSSASFMPGAAAKTMKALIEVCAYAHAMSLSRSPKQEGEQVVTAIGSSGSGSRINNQKEQNRIDHDAMLVRTLFVLGNLTAGAGPSADSNRRDIANAELGRGGRHGGGGIDGLRLIGRIISSRAQTLAKNLATPGMLHLKRWEEAEAGGSVFDEGGEDNRVARCPSLQDVCATREVEEVVVKSVRTLANLSLAPEIGKRLARDANVFDALLTVLNACASVDMPSAAARKVTLAQKNRNHSIKSASESKDGDHASNIDRVSSVRLAQATREELLTNVVSALSNISFYCTSQPHLHRGDVNAPAMISRGQEVSRVLISILLLGVSTDNDTRHIAQHERAGDEQEGKRGGDESPEAVAADRAAAEAEYAQHLALECARVFGNFSRSEPLRRAMRMTGADAAMILLLEHDCRDLVYSACGVLVNLAVSVKGKKLMLKATDLHPTASSATAVDKLLGVIRDAGLKDLSLVTLACRALYNLCLPASLPVEMAAKNTGRNARAAASQTPRKRNGAVAPTGAEDDEGKTSSRMGDLASAAASEAAATAALAAAVQITVPIPPRLLGSLIATLDELEAVASDIIEEAELEAEEDGDRSDYEDDEGDGYASVYSAREFVSVVRPLLASLEERMEMVSPEVEMRDGAAGYEGKQDNHYTGGGVAAYDDLEPLPEERPDGSDLSGRHAKK